MRQNYTLPSLRIVTPRSPKLMQHSFQTDKKNTEPGSQYVTQNFRRIKSFNAMMTKANHISPHTILEVAVQCGGQEDEHIKPSAGESTSRAVY